MKKMTAKIRLENSTISLRKLVIDSFKYLIMIILWLISADIYSQNQMISHEDADYQSGGSVTGCPNCVITLPPATIGKDYSFTIPLIESGDHTFEFDPPCNCSSGTIDIGTNTGIVTLAHDNFCVGDTDPDVIEFELLVKRTADNNEDRAYFRLPIVRRPFKLVFVLDISGSMYSIVQGSTESRWTVLNRAVNLFMDNLEPDSVKKDQIALTYFTSFFVPTGSPMGENFLLHTGIKTPVSQRVSTFIETDMANGRHPLARTSLGTGIQSAIEKLTRYDPTDTTRLIFLFTDGIQNEPPFVDPDGMSLAGGTIPINYSYPAGEGSMKISVAEVESFPTYADMLQNLAANNRGFYQSITIGDYNDFYDIFQNHFTNMLKDYSPQMVARRKGINLTGQSSESFNINKGVGRLHFQLTFNNGDSLSMIVEKDGTELTQYATANSKGYFKSLDFDMPLKTSPITTSAGKWDVKITGQNGKKYSLICIADDHFLDYECSLQKTDYSIGEPLKLSVKLKYNGSPLDSTVNQVKAIILKPGEDLGHLLATNGWDYHQPDSDIVDAATQKYLDLLRNDSTFYEALLPSEQVVMLQHDSAGYYSGQYTNTDLTGIYNVIFLMTGEIPGHGSFERTETHSQLFKFAETSDAKTDVQVSVDTLKNTATITVRPMNKFRKYMGPGLKNWINVDMNSKSARMSGVKDNLDGSYSFVFTGLPKGEDPMITISIRGVVLREKLLSKIENPQSAWKIWQILVLLLLILLLIFRLLKVPGTTKLSKWLLWLLVILWLIIVILVKLGILNL